MKEFKNYLLTKQNIIELKLQSIIKEELPLTIGGGIGQSRLCMLLLGRAHIGEVQASYWDTQTLEQCKKQKIELL
mgnify:CR=1 FL=1